MLVHAHLHIIDVIAVPCGAKEFVAKSKDQNVLHHLLAQVMVNSEDFLLFPIRGQSILEFPRASKILSKGFLDLYELYQY